MHIDIVILPPKEVSKRVGNFTAALDKKYKLARRIDNKKLLPHISLFHMNIVPRNLEKIAKQVKRLTDKHKQFGVKFAKTGGHGPVFGISIKPSRSLYKLHEAAVLSLFGYCSGKEDLPPGPKKTIHRQYIKKYGTGNILKCYWPHITLGWAKRLEDMKEIYTVTDNFDFRRFTAQRLLVAQVDNHHQVRKILKEYELKK